MLLPMNEAKILNLLRRFFHACCIHTITPSSQYCVMPMHQVRGLKSLEVYALRTFEGERFELPKVYFLRKFQLFRHLAKLRSHVSHNESSSSLSSCIFVPSLIWW
jgi:hypothetical protein